MASQINTILKQAITTFGGVREVFPQNLEKLRYLLDRISASDVGILGHDLLRSETWKRPNKAPVSYIDIYEDDLISIGVFLLKPGMKLPLHDHPHMYGLIKVIAGSLQISSYSVEMVHPDSSVEAERHDPITVNHIDGSCMLEPKKQNLHEIESLHETAAFIDILSPPYDAYIPDYGPRKCTYFKPVRQVGMDKLLLKVIDSPSWFWTDTYPYEGPEILDDVNVLAGEESENR